MKNIYQKILFPMIAILVLIGCKEPKSTESYTMMTILGTYSVDIESQKQGENPKSDLWFEHKDKNSFNLVPTHGMSMAIVDSKKLSNISKEFIIQHPLEKKEIGKDKLTVGKIIIFKTGEGHYGKLQIKGYRSLHDFNFPEAKTYLKERWKRSALSSDDSSKYNMVVAYKIYK